MNARKMGGVRVLHKLVNWLINQTRTLLLITSQEPEVPKRTLVVLEPEQNRTLEMRFFRIFRYISGPIVTQTGTLYRGTGTLYRVRVPIYTASQARI